MTNSKGMFLSHIRAGHKAYLDQILKVPTTRLHSMARARFTGTLAMLTRRRWLLPQMFGRAYRSRYHGYPKIEHPIVSMCVYRAMASGPLLLSYFICGTLTDLLLAESVYVCNIVRLCE